MSQPPSPRLPLPPLPPVNWSSILLPGPATNATNRTQLIGNCATTNPGNCNGHGILGPGSCFCICDAGYASDYSNLLAPKWCVPAGSVSTARNRTVDLITAANANNDGSGSQNVVWVWLGTTTGMSVTIALSVGVLVASLCFLFYCYRKYKRRCAAKAGGHSKGGGGGGSNKARASHYYHVYHNGAAAGAAGAVNGAAAGVLAAGGPGGIPGGGWPPVMPKPPPSNFFKSWWVHKGDKAKSKASSAAATGYGIYGSGGGRGGYSNGRDAYGNGDAGGGGYGNGGHGFGSDRMLDFAALGSLGADASPAMAAQLASVGRSPSYSHSRSPSYSQGQGHNGYSHGYSPRAQQGPLPGSPAAGGKSQAGGARSFVNPLAHMPPEQLPPPPYDYRLDSRNGPTGGGTSGRHQPTNYQPSTTQYSSPPPPSSSRQRPPGNDYGGGYDERQGYSHRAVPSPHDAYAGSYEAYSQQQHQHALRQREQQGEGIGGQRNSSMRRGLSYSGHNGGAGGGYGGVYVIGDAGGGGEPRMARNHSRSPGVEDGANAGGEHSPRPGRGARAAADGVPRASSSSTSSRRLPMLASSPAPSASAAAFVAAAPGGRGGPPPPPPGAPPPPPRPQQHHQPRSPKHG